MEAIPAFTMGSVVNARMFEAGDHVLLHHACQSPQADTDTVWWNAGGAWWACKHPLRDIDSNAHFDLNCIECAVRWAQGLS